jgi:uncharacterized protein YcbX
VVTVGRINVSPIKGTALHHPTRAALTAAGIPENRRFFLIDERGGLYTSEDFGPLLRVRAEYDPLSGRLSCMLPDGRTFQGDGLATDEVTTTDFYGRPVPGSLVPGPFAAAFSDFVGQQVRLVRAETDGDGPDVHHLTIVSSASVQALARGAGSEEPLDARRFRVNLELEGCAPYEEDSWDGHEVRMGTAVVRIHGQIPRCVVTTRDPESGLKDFETLKEIALQRERIPGDGGLPFGVYAEVERPGEVTVGDLVEPAP